MYTIQYRDKRHLQFILYWTCTEVLLLSAFYRFAFNLLQKGGYVSTNKTSLTKSKPYMTKYFHKEVHFLISTKFFPHY